MTKKINENKVYEYMLKKSQNGLFTGSYNEIAKACGFNNAPTASYHLNKLIDEGLVKVITKGRRGQSVAEYKVVHKKKESVPQEIIVEYRGIRLLLVYAQDYGYCLAKDDLAKIFTTDSLVSTQEYSDLIDLKISRNKEQFTKHMTIIGGRPYLDRVAVMLYLTKVDLDDSNDNKRQTLNEFQEVMSENMLDVMLRGKVEIDSRNKVRIQSNVCELLDLTKEQVKDLLEDVQYQFQDILNEKVRENKDLKSSLKKCQSLVEIEQARADNARAEMVEVRMGLQ